jgi:hypothetical protein
MAGELATPFAVAVADVFELAAYGIPNGAAEAAAVDIGSVRHEVTTFRERTKEGVVR